MAQNMVNKMLNRAWIKHEEILHGGTLVLIMDDKPSPWATHPLRLYK